MSNMASRLHRLERVVGEADCPACAVRSCVRILRPGEVFDAEAERCPLCGRASAVRLLISQATPAARSD